MILLIILVLIGSSDSFISAPGRGCLVPEHGESRQLRLHGPEGHRVCWIFWGFRVFWVSSFLGLGFRA